MKIEEMFKITQKKKAAKLAAKAAIELTHIEVIDNSYMDVTREADPDQEYSGRDTVTSHSIEGIKISKNYGDISVSFDVLPNTFYYLLYYLYGTGDSFGSDSGRIEFVELYRNEKLARKSCEVMNKFNTYDGNKKNKQNPVTIWNDSGQAYQEYISDDYFGGFEGAEVVAVQLI